MMVHRQETTDQGAHSLHVPDRQDHLLAWFGPQGAFEWIPEDFGSAGGVYPQALWLCYLAYGQDREGFSYGALDWYRDW